MSSFNRPLIIPDVLNVVQIVTFTVTELSERPFESIFCFLIWWCFLCDCSVDSRGSSFVRKVNM
jgi:hypothetical protein